ncbi:LIC11631 family protein [Leptospira borgpetersenii]|uniref:Uncharacterized protein n=1 Tax=Leptospira borgpetersenii serovar Javanica str. UI 09931 TaxID=1049767 RepID=A0AAV3JA99_LEPBO|nr:hypothetical protein [Leptospira borgpetersenii]AXX15997.1 hypothetical protein C4Q31_10980 [Leptospira borgpetersenii serovar Ceylonica]EKQ90863.1 hypothetical protein LEP1GSC101_1339 [Leptospira borgpetersenii str. UI 09149]EMN56678.1 hypothetical protein LEP1GSC090_0108 [Leptospira borgpetersenii serovar Javanica str. MK146]EPG57154.1 hypothetical protein LEP1GSC103_1753 [Leptospira borgpetersenii serovar Javanica str. UI 09931]MDQ7244164.1 hypothetical protein [Leptospira borgpetersenii
MTGTPKQTQKFSVFSPLGQRDIYALDNLYFSPLRENEVWDFSKVGEFSPLNLGFLCMRSILADRCKGTITLQGLNPGFVLGLSKINGFENWNLFKTKGFIPKVFGKKFPMKMNSKIHEILNPVLGTYEKELFEEWSPKAIVIEGSFENREILIAGVALPGDDKNLPKLLKNLIQTLSGNCGKFYLRTEKHSYLCLKKEKENIGPVFFQEKENTWDSFIFLILEIENT